MVHDNLPAGVIITNGLGGSFDSWIIAQFHLFLGRGSPAPIAIEIEVRKADRGVPHGLEGTRYDPRYWRRDDDDDEPWKPSKDEKEVVIKLRIGSKEVERHYFRKDAERVIKAVNLLNTTKSKVKGIIVTADKLKDITKKPFVYIKNMRKKDEDEGENE